MKISKLNSKTQLSFFLILIFAFCFLIFDFAPAHAQEDATASSVRDLVREKVKETLQTLSKDPRAVIGTLKQPSNNGFEIKTQDNKTNGNLSSTSYKTSLISTDSETKYYQVTKGIKKEVKSEDLAIGVFVVALGYQKQDVFSAQRVIGYDQSPLNFKKQIFFGNIIDLGKNTITVKKPKTSEEKTFKVTSKTQITEKLEFADIEKGNRVVVITTIDEKNNAQVSRVHVVKDVQATVTPTAVPTKSEATATPTQKPTSTPTP
ncbi:MAG: hypothetical protein A2782_01455 [Candidatus Blackburnbacteria bacterium RIFCSPHIGHO2_01_FULL_43_15b]|uniref:DUF5666 domain-containing protein n=1 Tax=Candidatus Blackburnbacteria bacterium RIFCSPHIGHO2_01_FULL_43_15b TaxID=1797513 RepID=A0A1G1UXG4_9BACT|nr:MAG: hypothetical protein A2782_01455 [Candidatus Blackburnbacteria bacterium RIFCSPHIGHO2_01_FULL_43_15b]